jgi:hypothetical protein
MSGPPSYLLPARAIPPGKKTGENHKHIVAISALRRELFSARRAATCKKATNMLKYDH